MRASDGELFAFHSIRIEVRFENAPPNAVPDAFEATMDEPVVVGAPGVLGNDSDDDGDQLVVRLGAPPDVGSVELASDGSFTYQAPPGFVGRAEFEYVVSDGLDESTAVVRIRIRVSRGIIDSEDREEVVAAVTTESRDAGRLAVPAPILTRSFVALSRSASVQINMLSIPLVLLGGLAVMAVTLGRVGSTPSLASRAQYGVLASFHESEGFGHIVTDDGIEYFVSRGAFKGKVVAVGSKVSFRAISAEPRYLAVRVWGV